MLPCPCPAVFTALQMGVVGLPVSREQPDMERKGAGETRVDVGGRGKEGEGGQKEGMHRWAWWACQ